MLQYSIIKRVRVILTKYFALFVFFSVIVSSVRVFAQEESEYDEISVFLNIPRVGGTEIGAVIRREELYLPVTDLFDFLKIRNSPSSEMDSISGFFINTSATYVISRSGNRISYQDKTFNLNPGDLIRTESNLYLRSSYFGKVFGLECSFSFRSLSVTVNSKLELPIIREMRQAEMRSNLIHLRGDIVADTNIGRSYPLFKFGMADWSINSSEVINGNTNTRVNLSLGSMIAGGEFTAAINYYSTDPFTEKQQYYLWRYVNNDFQPLRQVMAGKITTNAISSIFNPVVGVKLTNTPTKFRRSFGSYTLSDYTEPGWIVELYVNNVLVDYVTADASGFFTFEVPLVYGNTIVNLKFIGPWGEEKTKEQNINIPFNFLPVKTFEYTVSAGIVEDTLKSRISRASFNYGVTRSLTVGGGIEYLSSVTNFPSMPFLNASLRITNNLLFTGEFTYKVRSKSTLTYRLPSNMQFDLNYTWYDKDQKAINYNFREERKAIMSTPLRIGKFSSYQRLSLYQTILPSSKYTTAEWLFSGPIFGVNTNLTTYALFKANAKPYVYSNLSLTFRLPSGFVIMPQAQYGYTKNKLVSAKVGVEKHLLENAYLNLSYEQNFSSNQKMAELGFRYDFSFAQTGFSVRQSDNKTTLVQYARGSLINDRKTKYLGADNRTSIGKGGISIIPFIDLNSNGKRDPGEPKAFGMNIRVNGGKVEMSERDTTIRILGLEPYSNCFIELDPDSFENIAWRLPIQTMSVCVDPNVLKLIEIPVTVVGEANGFVTLEKNGELRGLGRIIICFYSDNLKPAGKVLTEEDGYFSYFGLAPGNYIVRVDSAQMRKLGMKSEPEILKLNIKGVGLDGVIIDGLDFTLKLKPEDTTIINPVNPVETVDTVNPVNTVIPIEPVESAKQEEPVVRKDTTYMIIHEATQELVTIAEDCYAIQLGAFKNKSNADVLRKKLEKVLGKNVEIIIENDFYKVRISGLKDREEVDENIAVLQQNGINEIWLTSLKAKQQLWVLREKQDTIAEIKETITKKAAADLVTGISIQVGAFRQESRAIELKNKLSGALDKKVVIVTEDGYFKVRIAGFENQEEIRKLLPSLNLLGVKDFWLLPAEKREEPAPVIQQIVQPDSTPKVVEDKIETPVVEEKPALPEPKVSLQVGRFLRKTQALRARRKITSKLNLPVEIVVQWDYFNVIVTGFYSRQETYKYYPELAGLGYPIISLIEKK
jgi:cell division protein FtsN